MQLDEAVEALYKLFCRAPSFHIALCRLDPDSGFDCSRCGQSMSRDWFTIQGNLIKPDFGYCPGCGGVATPYRDDTINPDAREAGDE